MVRKFPRAVTSLCLAGLALAVATIVAAPLTARAGFDVKVGVTIPAGQSATLVVQFTKDGTDMSLPSVDIFDNGTANPITTNLLAKAPNGANDRHYKVKYGPLTTDAEAESDLPDTVPDFGIYLASNNHLGNHPFITPFVLLDLNSNSRPDATDGSIYSLITNLAAYDTASSGFTFTTGQSLLTNASGQVAGLSGITFYTNSTFTTPAANTSLLIVGTASESVPEPATLSLVAIGASALLLRRRRVIR